MSTLTTGRFWKRATERAVKTMAQTVVATAGTAAVLEAVDWKHAASAAGLAGVLSVLTSVGSVRVGDDSPSLVE